MFLNEIYNFNQSIQILDRSRKLNDFGYENIAFSNQTDDSLNLVDKDTSIYAYQDGIQLFSDPLLNQNIKDNVDTYHTFECRLLDTDCICKLLQKDQINNIYLFKKEFSEIKAITNLQTFERLLLLFNDYCKSCVTSTNQLIKNTKTNDYQSQIMMNNSKFLQYLKRFQTSSDFDKCILIIDFIDMIRLSLNPAQNVTLDQFKMMLIILRDYQYPDKVQNIYILDSPTGTGKTFNFIFSSYLTRCLQDISDYKITGIQTLLFANTDIVAQQTAKTVASVKNTNMKCGFVEVVIVNETPNIVVSKYGAEGKYTDLIITTQPQIGSQFAINEKTTVLQMLPPEYKCKYIANTRYQYVNQLHVKVIQRGSMTPIQLFPLHQKDLISFYITDYINEQYDVLSLTLQNYQFLNMFGLIDIRTKISSVIFDEVDVFYSNGTLDEFYHFYFSQIFNLTAKTIIFSSATINSQEVNRIDYNISPELQITQKAMLNDQLTSICIQDDFPQIFTIHDIFTVTTIQDLQNLTLNLWQQGNAYFYFDIELINDSQMVTNSFCKLTHNKLTVKTGDFFESYTSNIQDQLIKHIKPFKRVFVTNKQLRNAQFLPFTGGFNRLVTQISTIKGLNMIRKLKVYNESINIKHKEEGIIKLINGIIQNQKTLVVTIKDTFFPKFLDKKYKKFTAIKENQTTEIYKKIKQLQYRKLNEKTPFDIQRLAQLSDSQYQEPNQQIGNIVLYDDFVNIGRGVDIEGLFNVILLIPMHYDFKKIQFGQSEFIQVVGRVGRFGKSGIIHIVQVEINIENNDIQALKEDQNQDLSEYIQIGIQRNIPDTNDELQAYLQPIYQKNKTDILQWTKDLQSISDSIDNSWFDI